MTCCCSEGKLSKEQGRLQRHLPTCCTSEDVLAVVREHGPTVFHTRLISAAFKHLVRTRPRHRADLQTLRQRSDFQLLAALAAQQAWKMGGQGISTVAWALAELQCRDQVVLDAVEGEGSGPPLLLPTQPRSAAPLAPLARPCPP